MLTRLFHRPAAAFVVAIVFLSGAAVLVPSAQSCPYGCPVSTPPYILIIYNQRVFLLPVATVVFVEFLALVAMVAVKRARAYHIRAGNSGALLAAIGAFIAACALLSGYGVGLVFLINGPALYPSVAEGFYGFGYLSVFGGLYEYNPREAKIWPTPMILVIACTLVAIGLLLHRRRNRRDKST